MGGKEKESKGGREEGGRVEGRKGNREEEGGCELFFLAGSYLVIVICSIVVFFCTQQSFQNTNIQC